MRLLKPRVQRLKGVLFIAALCLLPAIGLEIAPAAQPPAARQTPATKQPATDSKPAEAKQKLAAAVGEALERLADIPDYTYTLRKQERVDDELLEPQFLVNKIRHEPFSVYLRFIAPRAVEGKEAIYVEGKNDGKLIGHGVGLQALLGTVSLDPTGSLAMQGNRNPITSSGMKKLMQRIQKELNGEKFALYEVHQAADLEVDERPCFCFEIRNVKRSADAPTAGSRICFDRQWKLPVRFQRYYWAERGNEPLLVEDYTYLKVKFDCSFTDKDFDPDNPEYGF